MHLHIWDPEQKGRGSGGSAPPHSGMKIEGKPWGAGGDGDGHWQHPAVHVHTHACIETQVHTSASRFNVCSMMLLVHWSTFLLFHDTLQARSTL